MIALAFAGLPAGLATYLFVGVFGRKRRVLGYAIGLIVGIVAGILGVKLFFGRYDIMIASVVGAALGPVAALRLSKPYGFDY